MKYPLAIINRMIEVYGTGFQYGYDIACAFEKILRRSRLGPKVTTLGITGVVPAFHGHAHNRKCQLSWHPMYVKGTGKKDYEGCERVFSQSNALASVTRFASKFHRHQAIDEFFKHWDLEKFVEECESRFNFSVYSHPKTHALAGQFIFDNYKQSLKIIRDDSLALAALCHGTTLTSEDFEQDLEAERAYLANLAKEPAEVLQTVEYMDALQTLQSIL